MQQLPDYALPIFGTTSVASILGLLYTISKLREELTRFRDAVTESRAYTEDQEKRDAKRERVLESKYVAKDVYQDHAARLRHLESSCPNCTPLKETKATRREDV